MCCCGSNLSSCAELKWTWSLLSGAKLKAVLLTSGQYFLIKNGYSLCCCPSSSYLVHHLNDYPHRLKVPLFRDVNHGCWLDWLGHACSTVIQLRKNKVWITPAPLIASCKWQLVYHGGMCTWNKSVSCMPDFLGFLPKVGPFPLR